MPRIGRTFSIRTTTLVVALGGRIGAVAAALVVSSREYRDRIRSSLIAASRAMTPRINRLFSIRPARIVSALGNRIAAVAAALDVGSQEYRNRIGSSLAASRAIMRRTERTFSIRTAMLVLTVGSGTVAIATALV